MKVVEFYRRFGKVSEIDAVGSVESVYRRTKRALIPRFDFLIGPPGSNEVTKLLAERVGAKVLNFTDFFWERFINQHKDDEYITQQLIEYIENHRARRLLI